MSNDADPPEPDPPAETTTDEAAPGAETHAGSEESRRLWPLRRHRGEDDESFAHRLAHQWAIGRDERRHEPEPITAGRSNFSRAQVPWGLDLAAAWSWRVLVIGAAGYVIFRLLGYFSVIALPIVIALLITALVSPLVNVMDRAGIPRGLAAIAVVIGGIAAVAVLLTFVGQQVAGGASDLADSTVEGLGEIKEWLKDGPLHASDSQIDGYIEQMQDAIAERSKDGEVLSQVGEVGATVGHVVAGFFIVLFSTFFFLADGERIWSWAVRLAPRAARERVDSSGRVAWISLTQFVRATVIVALVDAIGIMIGAAIIGVPFVLAIGVLVFLGAFIPMVGATVAGSVAVLVALVDQGPIAALAMLAVVIGVQQLEGHILQPFLMGRWVSVHPLGVIVAIGLGVIVGGIAGALVAVPLAAALNAVVQHLASHTSPGDDPEEQLAEDYEEIGATDRVEDKDDVE
ncbi:MAG TPA: AI-2E family transporter [Nocardioides sp.]|nr:AI-2E family transporter [Nocardioides sp.]